LEQVSNIEELEVVVERIHTSVIALQQSVAVMKDQVDEPYTKISKLVLEISRMQETCELLRNLSRYLYFLERFKKQISGPDKDLVKACGSIQTLESILSANDLQGISLVDSSSVEVKRESVRLRNILWEHLKSSVEAENYGNIADALQGLSYLSALSSSLASLHEFSTSAVSSSLNRVVATLGDVVSFPVKTKECVELILSTRRRLTRILQVVISLETQHEHGADQAAWKSAVVNCQSGLDLWEEKWRSMWDDRLERAIATLPQLQKAALARLYPQLREMSLKLHGGAGSGSGSGLVEQTKVSTKVGSGALFSQLGDIYLHELKQAWSLVLRASPPSPKNVLAFLTLQSTNAGASFWSSTCQQDVLLPEAVRYFQAASPALLRTWMDVSHRELQSVFPSLTLLIRESVRQCRGRLSLTIPAEWIRILWQAAMSTSTSPASTANYGADKADLLTVTAEKWREQWRQLNVSVKWRQDLHRKLAAQALCVCCNIPWYQRCERGPVFLSDIETALSTLGNFTSLYHALLVAMRPSFFLSVPEVVSHHLAGAGAGAGMGGNKKAEESGRSLPNVSPANNVLPSYLLTLYCSHRCPLGVNAVSADQSASHLWQLMQPLLLPDASEDGLIQEGSDDIKALVERTLHASLQYQEQMEMKSFDEDYLWCKKNWIALWTGSYVVPEKEKEKEVKEKEEEKEEKEKEEKEKEKEQEALKDGEPKPMAEGE
jgi:hypothetical protein